MPSCPYWFQPQHETVPVSCRAQVVELPLTSSTTLRTPGTARGSWVLRGRPVTELAGVIAAPARDGPRLGERARELPPHRDLLHARVRDDDRIESHHRRAVTDLPDLVASKALHRPVPSFARSPASR